MLRPLSPQEKQIACNAAGRAALQFIKDGMLVGLGTGSTASCFIQHLIERCREGLKITAVATSKRSMDQAIKGGIPFVNINEITTIDVTVDGADEIDPQKRMIKGGGGALLREKIMATNSREMIVIVEENKCVNKLGKFPLPIEIVPFAYNATLHQLEKKGYVGKLRTTKTNELYLTDNGNYIFDIHFAQLLENPEEHERIIRAVPGVVETGFFFHLAGHVIVGYGNDHVEIRS
jgi:ribose 5-phosphate isomerase A